MRETFSHEFNWWQKMIAVMTGMQRINSGSIDFKWGSLSPCFGFSLLVSRGFYFDRRYRLTICLGWGSAHIKLPIKTRRKASHDWPSYGIEIYNTSLWIRTGDCEENQETRKLISYSLPFFSWIFDWHKLQATDNNWIDGCHENKNKAYKETHNYLYTLNSGETQECKATCFIEERQYHRKWMPLWRESVRRINVTFSDEIGEGRGSWKGGTTGCSWDTLEDESIESCLRRMEKCCKFK